MRRPSVKSAIAGALTVGCLVGLSFEASGQLADGTSAVPGPPAKLAGADLVSYTSCAQMLRQVKAEALKEVGPYGLPAPGGAYPGFLGGTDVARSAMAPVAQSAPSTGASPAGISAPTAPGYSTTNDQEAGVDEPDVVKTNGQLMVVLRQQPIGAEVIDVSGPVPQLDGFVALPQLASAEGLFLVGQDVVVVGGQDVVPPPSGFTGGGAGPVISSPPAPALSSLPAPAAGRAIAPLPRRYFPYEGAQSSTDVVVVSIADPENPVVQRTFSFQGEEQGARLINGQVVLALTDQPRLRWSYPESGTAAAQKAATTANRAVVESSDASDWLPSLSVRSGRGSAAANLARTATCSGTYHTVISSGLGTVSVASFDPTSDAPGHEVTVIGNAENVYASATEVFVATTAWPYQVGSGCPPVPLEACPFVPAAVAGPATPAPTSTPAPISPAPISTVSTYPTRGLRSTSGRGPYRGR